MTAPSNQAIQFKKRWILYAVLIVIGVSLVQGVSAPWRFMHASATEVTYAPKTGRIVDSDTGVGIPDVTVIVQGRYVSGYSRKSPVNMFFFALIPIAWEHGGRESLYTIVTKTDQQGNFSVPSTYEQTWDSVKNEGSGFMPREFEAEWELTPIKFGYLPWIDSDYKHVKSSSGDEPIALAGVKMKPAKPGPSGFKEELNAYRYAGILHGLLPGRQGPAGIRDNDVVTTETVALSRQGYPYFTSEVCALPPDESIDIYALQMILYFAPNEDKVMKALNPDLWESLHFVDRKLTGGQEAQRRAELKATGNLDKSSYRAADVCHAMKPRVSD